MSKHFAPRIGFLLVRGSRRSPDLKRSQAIVLCEDGDGGEVGGDNFIRVLTPAGTIETIARYGPDGKWLFVHIQYPGKAFAITGPWEKGWL